MKHPPLTATSPVHLAEKLRHLPPEAQAAFIRFQISFQARDLDPVIFAILDDFIPQKPETALAAHPGDTRLMDDLGFDSIAITETIFFTEELFGITISNEEILQVRTLDELRHFILRKTAVSIAG